MKTKKLAVIVGRFQAHELHDGYYEVLKYASENYDIIAVLIGDSYRKYTKHNPLPVELRAMIYSTKFAITKQLIKEERLHIGTQHDHKSDVQWSINLDKNVDSIMEDMECDEMNFIVGRDTFDKYYSGKYKDRFVVFESENEEVRSLSSTQTRESIKTLKGAMDYIAMTDDFAAGIIHTVQNQYPRVDPTVDVAPLFYKDGTLHVLMSRKATDEPGLFRFFGGFVDVSDETLAQAAQRELLEESKLDVNIAGFQFVNARKIYDWRYRDGKDGVMTTLFRVRISAHLASKAVPSDDLAGQELKEVPINELSNVIVPEHKELAQDLLDWWDDYEYENY